MAYGLPTADQLVQQAKEHAIQTRKLSEKQTTASGAVVGGPTQAVPSPAPDPAPGPGGLA